MHRAKMIDFTNINYLQTGTALQKAAFEVLKDKNTLAELSEFDALLAGTIPINIAIESSDLDIICCWEDKHSFITKLKMLFERENAFEIRETSINEIETVIARFTAKGFAFEIFGQNIPVKEQNAYRHMIIEYEILEKMGENFRQEILALKQKGYKTEPAFGLLLKLKNDPYQELLHYKI